MKWPGEDGLNWKELCCVAGSILTTVMNLDSLQSSRETRPKSFGTFLATQWPAMDVDAF
jgi:hypothetical protein